MLLIIDIRLSPISLCALMQMTSDWVFCGWFFCSDITARLLLFILTQFGRLLVNKGAIGILGT